MNLSATDRSSYELFKAAILQEHRLTPTTYRANFKNAIRTANESCRQFATRLRTLLQFYLESRNVNNSYESLLQLILADRLRDALSIDAKCFISDREDKNGYTIDKIADLIDTYEIERGQITFQNRQQFYDRKQSENHFEDKEHDALGENKKRQKPTCSFCFRAGHRMEQCYHKNGKVNGKPKGIKQIRVKRCFTCGSPFHLSYHHCNNEKDNSAQTYQTRSVNIY